MKSRLTMNLTVRNDWIDATVVVDASNIARDESLTGCSPTCWKRVETIINEWTAQLDPDALCHVIIDAGVASRLGRCCNSQYRHWRSKGAVDEVPFADPEILRTATLTGASVLSRDYFRDARRSFPWIDGDTSRFFDWSVSHDVVVFAPRSMGTPSEFSKSEHEERSEYKGRGVDIRRPEVRHALSRNYRCDTSTCWLHSFNPTRYTGMPDFPRDSAPLCNACRHPLTDIGPAESLVQVKIAVSGAPTVDRRTLSPGELLVVGRDSLHPDLHTALGSRLSQVSRKHVSLEWDGEHLITTDLASKNGTTIRRWLPHQHELDSPQVLKDLTVLHQRDEITLSRLVVITRSGRKFVHERSAPPSGPGTYDEPTRAENSDGI